MKKQTLKRKVIAQSAMEYLMTYGWAILIISLVLASLWTLGVFSSPGGGGGAACIGSIGYLCGTPVLESNGVLLTTIGQTASSGTMTVTSLGCSNSSTQPSTFYSTTISLRPSQAVGSSFICILPVNTIGAPFTGTLWIQYTLGTITGLVSKIGTVSTKVIVLGGASTTAPTGNYVPITLSNFQASSGTSSNFQQMITIGSSYSTYGELANMQNVEFTTGAGGTGSILQSWCESSCSSSSTSTWWVNLGSDIMTASPGPGNSITIYMDFMPSAVMSSSGPTGEAPQLTGTYGQYDNGASVFTNYWNFAGSSLPTGWTDAGITYTQNNGLTATATAASGAMYYSSAVTAPVVLDFYGKVYQNPASWPNQWWVADGAIVVPVQNNAGIEGFTIETGQGQYQSAMGYYAGYQSNGAGTQTYTGTSAFGITSNQLMTVYDTSTSTASYYLGYSLLGTLTSPTVGTPVYPAAFVAGAYAEPYTFLPATSLQYARIRTYPPNSVMPAVGFGSAV